MGVGLPRGDDLNRVPPSSSAPSRRAPAPGPTGVPRPWRPGPGRGVGSRSTHRTTTRACSRAGPLPRGRRGSPGGPPGRVSRTARSPTGRRSRAPATPRPRRRRCHRRGGVVGVGCDRAFSSTQPGLRALQRDQGLTSLGRVHRPPTHPPPGRNSALACAVATLPVPRCRDRCHGSFSAKPPTVGDAPEPFVHRGSGHDPVTISGVFPWS